MKIAFFEIEDWEKPFLEQKLAGHELVFYTHPLKIENMDQAKHADVVSLFIYSQITKEILDQLPDIKLFTTRSTGTDHIDLAGCKEKHIAVCNVPIYGTNTVAEHTFALLLAISRRLIPSVERARRGDFSLDNLRGFDLYGKTLGVIGVGNIGKAVIRIAKGFDMWVLGYSRSQNAQTASELGFQYVDLETLLRSSDIVSLHVPFNKETLHLINKQNISLFKPGSILINTARGGIVETEAILIGLERGILKAAGLDVLEEECMVKEERQLLTEQFLKECDIKTQLLNHVLLTKEKVIITPHNAFNSAEALQRILDVTVQNIQSFAQHSPKNVVR